MILSREKSNNSQRKIKSQKKSQAVGTSSLSLHLEQLEQLEQTLHTVARITAGNSTANSNHLFQYFVSTNLI